ncbi:MAG TPA: serine/threonine-protein kinase [Thermoleophilaceae bacterium]|nr:serine/threonine-protein kinase [Thermoleophilaceae bacterium]
MAKSAPGSVVAGCRIEEVIGRGGMGVVYRATQESLRRRVAVKLIAPEVAGNPDFRERFKRESLLAASIEHPNVIPVYDAGETEDLLYLVMRFIEGIDLRALIDSEGALDPRRAARIVGQLAEALGAAHRRGLIHRDVKPANVLIERSGGSEHAYLTDFGIARDLGSTTALTRVGSVVGTLDYIAPERLETGGGDGRSDLYALGCVLFETLTARVPFPKDSDVAKMYAHMNEPVPSARDLRPEVPEGLAAVAAKAMAKSPDDRYDTADEFAEALAGDVTAPTQPAPPGPLEPPTRLTPGATAPGPTPPEATPLEATPPEATAPGPTPPGPTPPEVTAPGPAAPAPPPAGPPTGPTRRLRSASRRRLGVIAAVAAAVAVVAVAVLVLAGGSDEQGGRRGSGGGSPRALSPIDVGRGADGVEVGAGSVWVANKNRGTLLRVDPASRSVASATQVGANPDSVAVAGGTVWVTNTDDDDVSRVNTRTGEAVGKVPVGDAPEGILARRNAVWVANSGAGSVTRIDPGGGPPRTTSVGSEPIQLAFDGRAPWVTVSGDGAVAKLDPATGTPSAKVRIDGSPRGIAFAAGHLWVSASDSDQVVVVDPSSARAVARVKTPDNPREVRAGEGGVWVTCAGAALVVKIDTSSRKVEEEVRVRGMPFGLGVGEGRVWAASLNEGLLTPIEPR